MNIEKEKRYLIDDSQYQLILKNTTPVDPECDTLDITFGYEGFNSLNQYGFVCRIRQKKNKTVLEVKKKMNEGWLEQEVKINSISEGINFYTLLNMKPYMFLKKKREIRQFKNLKIFLDKVDLLGCFVEIEYQDSIHSKEEIQAFKKIVKIDSPEEDLYGNIIMKKMQEDLGFKNNFEKNLTNLINEKKEEI